MPRITAERREANRGVIIAAARRCFSRDGFHQTSMPDIAAEAGVSTGAPYRYFASKEEIILEIAGDAFRVIFDPVIALIKTGENLTLAELAGTSIDPVAGDGAAPVEESLRCAVQTWSEILRHDGLRAQAQAGFDDVRRQLADAVRRGQLAGTVPGGLDPDSGSRIVMALLHGFVLQRVAFGLTDVDGFARDVRRVLVDTGVLNGPS